MESYLKMLARHCNHPYLYIWPLYSLLYIGRRDNPTNTSTIRALTFEYLRCGRGEVFWRAAESSQVRQIEQEEKENTIEYCLNEVTSSIMSSDVTRVDEFLLVSYIYFTYKLNSKAVLTQVTLIHGKGKTFLKLSFSASFLLQSCLLFRSPQP